MPLSLSPRLRRILPWLLAGLVLATCLGAAAGYWAWPRRIRSKGGLYFPRSVRLAVPVFAQGDPRWRDDFLGPTSETLHESGCAVASAAMVLASYGVDTDPGRLNEFLQEHDGYTPEGYLYWEKAAEFAPGTAQKAYEDLPSYALIDWNLIRGNPVIVRVKLAHNSHFVVIAGKRGWKYLICDPGAGADRGLYPLRELARRVEALRYYRRLR